jgi:hypothetical protein
MSAAGGAEPMRRLVPRCPSRAILRQRQTSDTARLAHTDPRRCHLVYKVTDADMTTYRPLFLPTARQTNWLLVIAFLCLGEAMYVRYRVMENATMSLACQGGLNTWLCGTFRLTTALYPYQVFGGAALAIAVLNLLRPSIVLLAAALAAAAYGVVMHNADLSALAAGVLILSLARPAPTAE